MAVVFKGQTYYRSWEACEMAGVSWSTLLRLLKSGILKYTARRDRWGWRLFSKADIERIEVEASRVT
jgi:predicted site-specific integrase-resolvase